MLAGNAAGSQDYVFVAWSEEDVQFGLISAWCESALCTYSSLSFVRSHVCVDVCAVELQPQSITLGSTLLEHLLMSLNETKKKLE